MLTTSPATSLWKWVRLLCSGFFSACECHWQITGEQDMLAREGEREMKFAPFWQDAKQLKTAPAKDKSDNVATWQ